jgi:hypothetical protein
MTEREALVDLLEAVDAAISSGDWKVDGACDPDAAIQRARDALAQPKQKPVAWEGGEGWESLAWELCADENGEDSCNELIWEGGPIPEPWGDRWMKYEYEAKRLIALVQKHTTPPQRKPLTDEEIESLYENTESVNWARSFARAIEAAHGIKGEA